MKKNREYYVKKLEKLDGATTRNRIISTIGVLSSIAFNTSGLAYNNTGLVQIGTSLLGASGLYYGISQTFKEIQQTNAKQNLLNSPVSKEETILLKRIKLGNAFTQKISINILTNKYGYTIEEISHRTGINADTLVDVHTACSNPTLRDIEAENYELTTIGSNIYFTANEKMAKERLETEVLISEGKRINAHADLEDAIKEFEALKNPSRCEVEHYRRIINILTETYTVALNSERETKTKLLEIEENAKQRRASELLIYQIPQKNNL